MRKITNIENDCFYIWLDKHEKPKKHLKFREILIGDSIGGYLKDTGMVKFKKFFEKDLKKERSIAYRFEKRFKKEPGSKWFIISKIELTKGKVSGCKDFHKIEILNHKQFKKTNNAKPLRKEHYYYIVNF